MKNPLQMREKDWKIVETILEKYPYTFYAYGSRVTKKAHPYSDLDLCYKENIPLSVVSKIEEAFIESDLPFTVDLLHWQQCDPSFQEHIAKDLLPLKEK